MNRKKPSRLRFTDTEQDGGRLKEHDRAKDREADRAAMRKDVPPPKDRKKLKRRMIDQKSGAGKKKSGKSAVGEKTAKTKGHLQFEEARPAPPSKLSHAVKTAPVNMAAVLTHQEISKAEADNTGLESAHGLEEVAEGGYWLAAYSRRAYKRHEYRTAERAEINALYRQSLQDDPELASNPLSRWQQKQAIKKQYAAAKRSGQTAESTARATTTMADRVSDTLKGAAEGSRQAGEFIVRHKRGVLIVIGLFLIVVMLLNVMSSCSVLAQALLSGGTGGTFPCADADMLGPRLITPLWRPLYRTK